MSKRIADNGGYFKSILTLMSGSAIAQVFTIICSPILTRICSAEDLGLYSLVTGAITIFGMAMSLRYEMCIVSEENENKIYAIVKLSFFICIGMSLITFVIYLVYFSTRSFENNPFVLAIITAGLAFLLGVINIVTAYNNRHKEYKLITTTYVLRMFCQNAGNLIAGFLHLGAMGLSLSQLIGYFAGVRAQSKPLVKHKQEILSVTGKELMDIAKDNIKQPLMSAPAAFANGLSYSLINYFIEALFSTKNVGYYSISFRILGLPLTLISANVSKVFMEKASREYQEKGDFVQVYISTINMMFIIAIPMGVLLMILSPWACEVAFGEEWHVAGDYIRILAPMMALRFVAGGINCAAIIVNKQQYDLIIQITLTISIISIFIVSKLLLLTITQFLLVMSFVFSLIYIIYIFLFWKCAKGK